MFTKIAIDTALALTCSFSNSAMLGEWTSGGITVERSNRTTESCSAMDLRLTCEPNNELRVEWRYRCNKWMDWNYGGVKYLPMSGEKILGQDGSLKADEFFYDSLIPREGGTKFEIKMSGPDSAGFVIGEDPKYFYPEYTYRGRFTRAKNLNWEAPQLFTEDKLNGKWEGDIRVVHKDYNTGLIKDETVCPMGNLDFDFKRYRLFQTQIYAPDCGGEEVNYYLGPHYFKNADVFGQDWNGNMVLQGTATAGGFAVENKTTGYKIKSEDAQWEEGKLTYRATEKYFDMTIAPPEYIWKEFILELRRPK